MVETTIVAENLHSRKTGIYKTTRRNGEDCSVAIVTVNAENRQKNTRRSGLYICSDCLVAASAELFP